MIDIIPYDNSDKEAVLALLRSNTPKYFDVSEEVEFIEYLDNEIESYFVAKESNIVVGAGGVNYFFDEKIARISWGMIHPDYQGKGIGKKLTLHRIEHIRTLMEVDTIVVRTSQLVYKFYEKIGFEIQEIKKDYWAKDFDMYVLTMKNNI